MFDIILLLSAQPSPYKLVGQRRGKVNSRQYCIFCNAANINKLVSRLFMPRYDCLTSAFAAHWKCLLIGLCAAQSTSPVSTFDVPRSPRAAGRASVGLYSFTMTTTSWQRCLMPERRSETVDVIELSSNDEVCPWRIEIFLPSVLFIKWWTEPCPRHRIGQKGGRKLNIYT